MERTARRTARRQQKTDGDSATTTPTTSDNSLGALASKFIDLMARSPDGVVDLSYAASVLNVKKRRIYDVTNVLEGVELVSRCRKSTMKWVGSRSSPSDPDESQRVAALRGRIAELEIARGKVEEDIRRVHEAMRTQERDEAVMSHAYVRLSDLANIPELRNSNLFIVTGSHDIEVFDTPTHDGKRHRVTLMSSEGPLNVTMCNAASFRRARMRRDGHVDPSDSASSSILRH